MWPHKNKSEPPPDMGPWPANDEAPKPYIVLSWIGDEDLEVSRKTKAELVGFIEEMVDPTNEDSPKVVHHVEDFGEGKILVIKGGEVVVPTVTKKVEVP